MRQVWLVQSVRHAAEGIAEALRTERTFKIQAAIAGIVVCIGFFHHFPSTTRALLLFVVAVVLGFELFNTALERLANVVAPDHSPAIKAIKDLSAAAVLIMVIGSIAVGALLIFG